MTLSRLFQPTILNENETIQLEEGAAHHIARVLRAKVGDDVILFNGEGNEYAGVIASIDKKAVSVHIKKLIIRCSESPLELYLAQGISRGEKMDYTIQKAVELGVKKIYPLSTERCNVKLDEERREKRLQHWRSIIISACEQSGRNQIPYIESPQTLEQFLEKSDADFKFVLAPLAEKKLAQMPIQKNSRVILMIGPEGGLSEHEIRLAEQKNFLPLNLGPRVLRTETAAVAAIAALQCLFGDLSS
ncbi:MAG: 16S rRNA (uracil(1498)-N(3))-methyltransferase [Gammaproteobacteria bacterium]